MKTWRYGIAIGLLAGLGACSDMMGHGGGDGAATKSSAMTQPTVAPNMVKQVQSKLRDQGYYKQGTVDGVWGSGTETAVRSFQKDHNLTSNGELDVPTLQALNIANDTTSTDSNTNTEPPQNSQPAQNSPPAQYTPAQHSATQPMGTNPGPAPTDNMATAPAQR